MNTWYRLILNCNLMIMRLAIKMINKESTKENEYCWLENSVTELERLVKDKL